MDFLNDAVAKAKDVFDVACKKTSEVVATQKQKIDIASIEHKRSKDFEELGILYYKQLKNTDISDIKIKEIFDEITAKTEKIAELRRELEASKNKIICPNCNAAVDNASLYCNICGEKI